MEVPDDVAIQQKLAGKKTFSGSLFASADDQAAKQLREEAENQPDWWQSEAGACAAACLATTDANLARGPLPARAKAYRRLTRLAVCGRTGAQGRSTSASTTPRTASSLASTCAYGTSARTWCSRRPCATTTRRCGTTRRRRSSTSRATTSSRASAFPPFGGGVSARPLAQCTELFCSHGQSLCLARFGPWFGLQSGVTAPEVLTIDHRFLHKIIRWIYLQRDGSDSTGGRRQLREARGARDG